MDKRYKQTHLKILQTFKEIILEKDYRDISISEVSEKADINRKTFYRHFDSTHEILEELQEEIIGDLSELKEYITSPFSIDTYRDTIKGLLNIIYRNKELHSMLISNGEYRYLFNKIRNVMTEQISISYGKLDIDDQKKLKFYLRFVSFGFLFSLGEWLSSKNPIPEEEFIDNSATILYNSRKVFIKEF